MNIDLSNHVIARFDDLPTDRPRRTLDLGSIQTPELGLLSPRRSEIAPRGVGRDAALLAYSERLRNSYRMNEGGLREGMLKLGEAFREGQTINISCFCRAGEACHADVVKIAVAKVGHAMMAREAGTKKSQELPGERIATSGINVRTQRAINEILSVGRTEMLLANLEETQGRNRSDHASHLNGQSQFARDLYERGAMVRDGVLIFPKENGSSSPPPAVTTTEYAVKKLSALLGESRAKDLAPRIVEYGTRIAGSSADRETQIKTFIWIYGALDGRNALLTSDEKIPENESKEERVERVLKEISGLAEEMNRLEPSDKLVLTDQHEGLTESDGLDRADDELSIEHVYNGETAHDSDPVTYDSPEAAGSQQQFERIELPDTTLSRLASDMSKDELDRWVDARLPALDEALESGTPVDSLLRLFENNVYHAAKEGPAERQAAIDDLKFASAYLEHQLKQPESRLRHFNPRYRNYAQILERASSRDEVIEAASKVRLENARLGFEWKELPASKKAETPHPLTAKQMQFLFTETSPRHYTAEMTAAKLSYLSVGNDAKIKTDSLMRGEISPGPEASQLIDSLESRLGRRQLKDSVSATRHFLQSLKTSNEELRYKNTFDHSDVYRKLPAAERDFVYQRAVLQKERLEAKLFDAEPHREKPNAEMDQKVGLTDFSVFREELKSEILDLVRAGSKLDSGELAQRSASLLGTNLERNGLLGNTEHESVKALSRELSQTLERVAPALSVNHTHPSLRNESTRENVSNRQNRNLDIHTR